MLADLLTNSFYRSEKRAKSWFKETIIKSSINLWPLPSLLTVLFNQSNVSYGAVHKRHHQSRESGVCQKMMLLKISLFSKSDGEGGGGQKSQKINDVFYERPLS